MHIEILIEDLSGKKMLEILMQRLVGADITYDIHKYKGIGHLPKNISDARNAGSKALLNNLPKLLNGLGKTFQGYEENYPAVVFVIMDLDKNNFSIFRNQLLEVLDACDTKPETKFCIAIEEGEAWLLGDINAIRTAYPNAKTSILNSYENDSICGTWEVLADAIHPLGSSGLKSGGIQVSGTAKCEWAEKITPYMDLDNNLSPSFNYFYSKMNEIVKDIS
ncbi:MAG: DUF4276 family protein [Sulfuricurvum sp.]|jgi:hypothetical protein|uniref:hypothetical protein n=1 Tax=Sulfuricurvum sp. TaxID=2025608 RepID=UPI0025D92B73|nr:hypothetical protein [Sulfuricurvum sp.]MCK9372940.1 DUF4276 family protein [Sulfuricurvum sp.]